MDIFKTARTISNFNHKEVKSFWNFWEHLETTKSLETNNITWQEMWATQIQVKVQLNMLIDGFAGGTWRSYFQHGLFTNWHEAISFCQTFSACLGSWRARKRWTRSFQSEVECLIHYCGFLWTFLRFNDLNLKYSSQLKQWAKYFAACFSDFQGIKIKPNFLKWKSHMVAGENKACKKPVLLKASLRFNYTMFPSTAQLKVCGSIFESNRH